MKRMRIFVILLALGLVAAACGTSDDTTTTAAQQTTTTAAAEETTTTQPAEAGMKTGVGVDPDTMTIKLGALHDLTGPFSPLVIPISDGMQVYYDTLNANGGIDGWMIDYIVEDTAYNVEQHLELYEAMRNEVLALTASTGTPTSVAALGAAMEDNMTFIPLSWYSGWAIPEFDSGLALELGTNYCIEAMNLMEFIRDNGGQTVAVAGFPSDYGLDFAAGVKLAADFYGMDVVFAAHKGVQGLGPLYTPWHEVLETSDVLTLHAPLTPVTRNMISGPEFRVMRRCPLLINTSRGGLVDEQALVEALDTGAISGAGFDVLTSEPPRPDNPLLSVLQRPNVIVTPHVAWASVEAMQTLWNQTVQHIDDYLRGSPSNVVTPPAAILA